MLLGFDLVSGLIVIFTVTLIVVDTYGMCALWGVDFNALTLINLIGRGQLVHLNLILVSISPDKKNSDGNI